MLLCIQRSFKEVIMAKRYIVRLTEAERGQPQELVSKAHVFGM